MLQANIGSFVLPPGHGRVYYVAQTSNTSVYDYFMKNYQRYYRDSSITQSVHSGIQAALDCCVSGRNDYVIAAADAYTLSATLTMSANNVHLICPAGLGADIGANNAARLTAYAATNAITITGSSCEVAGFYVKNANQYSAVSIGAVAHGTHIHHNHFPLIWASGAQAGAIVSNGGTMLNIERNYIFNYTGGQSLTCAAGVIAIHADGYLSRVSNNIITIGAGAIATKAIAMECSNGMVNHNLVSESGGSGTAPGGDIGSAISVSASCAVIGNRCAVASGAFSDASGTTGKSYCDNMDGICDGAGALTAQLET